MVLAICAVAPTSRAHQVSRDKQSFSVSSSTARLLASSTAKAAQLRNLVAFF
jgi:hypothetical protein